MGIVWRILLIVLLVLSGSWISLASWNSNVPQVTNQLSSDVPKMNANFQYLYDILKNHWKFTDNSTTTLTKDNIYFVDDGCADQGVAGCSSTRSVKDIIDACSGKYCVMYFPHRMVSTNTNYQFKTGAVIQDNISVKIDNGALLDTSYSVTDGGSSYTWTLHSGSIYKLDQTIAQPETVYESGVALTEVANTAAITGASKWCWESNKLYVRTSGSVDPDTLASGTMEAGVQVTFGNSLDTGNFQIFAGYGVPKFEQPEHVYARWWPHNNDGTNDDTFAIDSAIGSLPLSGGTVHIHPGNWAFNTTITKSNVALVGMSREYQEYEYGTELVWRPYVVSSPVVTLGGTTLATRVQGTRMEDFIIQTDASAGYYGLWVRNAERSTIRDFEIKGFTKYALKIGDNESTTEDNTQMNDFSNFRLVLGANSGGESTYGIVSVGMCAVGTNCAIRNQLRNFFIWGPWGTDTGACIYNPGSADLHLQDCTTQPQSPNSYSIYISFPPYTSPTCFYVDRCYFEVPSVDQTNIYTNSTDTALWRLVRGRWGGNGWFEDGIARKWNIGQMSDAPQDLYMMYDAYIYRMNVEWTIDFKDYGRDGNGTSTKRIYQYADDLNIINDNGTVTLQGSHANGGVVVNPAANNTTMYVGVAASQTGIAISNSTGYGIYSSSSEGGVSVAGESNHGYGIWGISNDNGTGVVGHASTGTGGWFSADGSGGIGLLVEGNGVTTPSMKINGLAAYDNNTAALAGGLTAGMVYRSHVGVLMIAY
jgi:hypothetical protein